MKPSAHARKAGVWSRELLTKLKMSQVPYILSSLSKPGEMEMLVILLGEILMGVLAYRRAKANGTLPGPAPEIEATEPHVQQPLGPNATRKEKILHWLGIEEIRD
jgi:hypothetical protein